MKTFGEFLSKKERDRKKRLKVVGRMFKKAGFKVRPHLDDHNEPHLYVARPQGLDEFVDELSFGGVRVFMRGSDLVCFRPQMKDQALPFGTTYLIDIPGMYRDMMEEDEKTAAYKVIFYSIQQLKDFFVLSGKAEADTPPEYDDARMGVVVGGTGTDYASKVTAPSRS